MLNSVIRIKTPKVAVIVLLVFWILNLSSCYVSRTPYTRNKDAPSLSPSLSLIISSLNGNVKSFSEARYEAVEQSGKIKTGERYRQKHPWLRVEKHLTRIKIEEGNPIKALYYDVNKELIEKGVFKYDDSGNKTKEEWYNIRGRLIFRKNFIYDERGNLIEENSQAFVGDIKHFLPKRTYSYCENGLLTASRNYGIDDRLILANVYVRDEFGKLLQEQTYWPDGTLIWNTKSTYDELGELTRKKRYSGEGVLVQDSWYENGQLAKFRQYNFDGGLTAYTYNENGQSISKSYNRDGRPVRISTNDEFGSKTKYYDYQDGTKHLSQVYKYNNQGTTHKTISYGSDGTVEKTTYDYEYDKQGNWIRKIQFVNEKAKSITVREIEYYD